MEIVSDNSNPDLLTIIIDIQQELSMQFGWLRSASKLNENKTHEEIKKKKNRGTEIQPLDYVFHFRCKHGLPQHLTMTFYKIITFNVLEPRKRR